MKNLLALSCNQLNLFFCNCLVLKRYAKTPHLALAKCILEKANDIPDQFETKAEGYSTTIINNFYKNQVTIKQTKRKAWFTQLD